MHTTFSRATGAALRQIRQGAGLTLRQLATIAETNYTYLGQVERGERSPSADWMAGVTTALGRHLAERAA